MSTFYDVEVWSSEDEDGGALWWGAEAGLEDNSTGVEFEPTQDLTELVNGVHDEVLPYRRKWPELQVRWLHRREPATDFLAAAQAAGVTLP